VSWPVLTEHGQYLTCQHLGADEIGESAWELESSSCRIEENQPNLLKGEGQCGKLAFADY
jgi:hypothetical protein